ISASQGDSDDLIRRAVAAFNSGDHGQAMDLCELGLKRHPGDSALCHLMAAVLFARADLPGARTRIEARLAARHDNVTARLLAWERGAPAEAEGFLEDAVARGGHPAHWFDLGLVRQDMRKFDGAAAAYRRVLEMSPDAAPEAAVNLGVVLQEAGDLEGAMAAY